MHYFESYLFGFSNWCSSGFLKNRIKCFWRKNLRSLLLRIIILALHTLRLMGIGRWWIIVLLLNLSVSIDGLEDILVLNDF